MPCELSRKSFLLRDVGHHPVPACFHRCCLRMPFPFDSKFASGDMTSSSASFKYSSKLSSSDERISMNPIIAWSLRSARSAPSSASPSSLITATPASSTFVSLFVLFSCHSGLVAVASQSATFHTEGSKVTCIRNFPIRIKIGDFTLFAHTNRH